MPEFLALTQEAATGALHMRMQQYKQEGKQEPLYEHLGGTSAKQLARYGKPRPDGKSLSRVVKLTISTRSDYFLTADCGPGEENKTGLIVPRFGTKPEQHVSVILSWRQLNELLLTTTEHYRAWLAAKYMAEWTQIHAPRFDVHDRKPTGQTRAPNDSAQGRKATATPTGAQPRQPEPSPPPAQPAPPPQEQGFASAFGAVYGGGNGKPGADDTGIF